MIRRILFCTLAVIALTPVAGAQNRWTPEKANAWYASQPWLVGANYIPSDAINQFEMFQAESFNPAINDRELGLAEAIGMNTMRVFLQDQLWQQDPKGFVKRLDAFLAIAAKHHIRPMLVLFDSCWEPNPHTGPQHPPIPGIHNSGWVQSPGHLHGVYGARCGQHLRYDSAAGEAAECRCDQLGSGRRQDADVSSMGLMAEALRVVTTNGVVSRGLSPGWNALSQA